MVPVSISPAPRHSTNAVQTATVTVTIGESDDLIFRAWSADFMAARLTLRAATRAGIGRVCGVSRAVERSFGAVMRGCGRGLARRSHG